MGCDIVLPYWYDNQRDNRCRETDKIALEGIGEFMKKLEKVGPFPLSFVFYALIEVKTSVFATVCLPFVLKLKLF